MKPLSLLSFSLFVLSLFVPTADCFAQVPSLKVSVNRSGAILDLAKTGGTANAAEFTAYMEADRSYECGLYSNATSSTGEDPNAMIDTDHISVVGSIFSVQAYATGNASPFINGDPNTANRRAARVAFRATQGGLYRFPFTTNVGSWTGTGADTFTLRAECRETTLYGGFNTFVNNFNFLELTNTSNQDITGQIKLESTGLNVITIDFFVTARGRKDIDLHSRVGPSTYGTVTVAHNGNAGSLTGYVSQYRGTAASFELEASLPLALRAGEPD